MSEIKSYPFSFGSTGIMLKSSSDETALTQYADLRNLVGSIENTLRVRPGYSRLESGIPQYPNGSFGFLSTTTNDYRYAITDQKIWVAGPLGTGYLEINGGSGMSTARRALVASYSSLGTYMGPRIFFADGTRFVKHSDEDIVYPDHIGGMAVGNARNVGIANPPDWFVDPVVVPLSGGAELTTINDMQTEATWVDIAPGVSTAGGASTGHSGTRNSVILTTTGVSAVGTMWIDLGAALPLGDNNTDNIEIWIKYATPADATRIEAITISLGIDPTAALAHFNTRFEKSILPSELTGSIITGSRPESPIDTSQDQQSFDDLSQGSFYTKREQSYIPQGAPPAEAVWQAIRIPKISFLRVGQDSSSAPTLGWDNVYAIKIEVKNTDNVAAPSVVSFDDWVLRKYGNLYGVDLQWRYTYYDATTDTESDLSDAAVIPYPPGEVNGEQVQVTFPVSPSIVAPLPRITHYRLYRMGGTITQLQLVAEIPYTQLAAVTYIDNIPDESLGQVADLDNQPPPAGAKGVALHNNRLWIWGCTSDAKNILRYSKNVRVEIFPLDNNVVVGTGSEEILRAEEFDSELVVWTKTMVYRIVGSDENSYIAQSTPYNIGIGNTFAIACGRNVVYQVAYDGIYEFPSGKKISEPLNPIFHQETVNGIPAIATAASALAKMALAVWDNKLYFSYASQGATENDNTLVYDILYNRWYRYDFGTLGMFTEPTTNILTAGIIMAGHHTMQLDSPVSYYDQDRSGNTGIFWRVITKDLDLGAPDQEKRFIDIVVDANAGGTWVNLFASFNGLLMTPIGSFLNTARDQSILPVPTSVGASQLSRRMQMQLSGNTTSNITGFVELFKIIPRFIPEPMRHKNFVTDWENYGIPGSKIFRELHIEMDTFGANLDSIQVEVDGAAPAGGLFSVGTGHTMATTGRTMVYYPLGVDVKGTLARLRVNAHTGYEVKVYSHNFVCYPEPDSVQFFQTPWSDEGAPNLKKRFRKLMIEIDNLGPGNVDIDWQVDNASVLPTPTKVLSTETGRQEFVFSIGPDIVGTLWRVVAAGSTSSTRFRFYRAWVDAIPEPFSEKRYESPWDDDGIPMLKRYRDLIIDADTNSSNVTLTVWVDGAALPGTFTLNTTTRKESIFSLPLDTLGKITRITATGTTRFTIYKFAMKGTPESPESSITESAWSSEGWPYKKLWREIVIEADTLGVPVTATFWLDGVATAQTFPFTHTGRQLSTFSLNKETIGKIARVTIVGAVKRDYSIQYVVEKQPPDTTLSDTYERTLSFDRFKSLRRLWISAKNPAVLQVEIWIDGVISYASIQPINNPVYGYKKTRIDLPDKLKGKLVRMVLSSQTRFQVFFEDTEVEVRNWNTEDSYNRVKFPPPQTF